MTKRGGKTRWMGGEGKGCARTHARCGKKSKQKKPGATNRAGTSSPPDSKTPPHHISNHHTYHSHNPRPPPISYLLLLSPPLKNSKLPDLRRQRRPQLAEALPVPRVAAGAVLPRHPPVDGRQEVRAAVRRLVVLRLVVLRCLEWWCCGDDLSESRGGEPSHRNVPPTPPRYTLHTHYKAHRSLKCVRTTSAHSAGGCLSTSSIARRTVSSLSGRL